MNKYFNRHDLTMNNPLVQEFQAYLKDYQEPMPKTDDDYAVSCYIEEYMKDGKLAARLRDKKSNKSIVLWTSPNDPNAIEHWKGLLEFMSDTKRMNKPDFFDRNGKSSIMVAALLLKETEDTILLSSYFAELFYQEDASLLA